jgi:hypothetical protein
MRQLIFAFLLFPVGLISTQGQSLSEDTYCIKLKKPSKDKYFIGLNMDSIPTEWRTNYEVVLRDIGKLLSRFSEDPLTNSGHESFRSISFGPFNDPKDVSILKIERWDDKVQITMKLIQKLKDSTIMVQKKTLGTEVWDKFEDISNEYVNSQTSYKSTKTAIHDGGATILEGYSSNGYYFFDTRIMSNTVPDLMKINRFLFETVGPVYGVNCKRDTREN